MVIQERQGRRGTLLPTHVKKTVVYTEDKPIEIPFCLTRTSHTRRADQTRRPHPTHSQRAARECLRSCQNPGGFSDLLDDGTPG
jgi:hypothetical protein